jgi:hypothetical protein
MYNLQSKVFFIIIVVVLGLFIFQTAKVNERDEIISQQSEHINLINNNDYTNTQYRNISDTPMTNKNPVLKTQQEIYLNSKVKSLEVELNSLRNQFKAIQNENNNLKSQISTLKEQRNLRFKELHGKYGQDNNKNASFSKPSTLTTGYEESFEVKSDTMAI